MRIVLWHGYLLGGTGSNVYSRALAREWSLAGHDVTVVCQERQPEQYDLAGARVIVPELPGGLLPTFVMDRYEGLQPKLLQDFTHGEKRAYVEANAAVLREHLPAGVLFTNHVLMGGPVGAATGAPFRVKAHGSELEYSMRGRPELEAWGRESLEQAELTFVGSEHIRNVLRDVTGHTERVVEVPPGVDVDLFVPEDRDTALAGLIDEARADAPNPGNAHERLPDDGNAERLAAFLRDDAPTVLYFGKLIEQKGVQVLLEAMKSVDARLVVVGFGPYRATLEALAPPRTIFTGPLEHRHLRHLLPPLVARHSGLAEIADGLEEQYPPSARDLASFRTGDPADLAEKLNELLALPDREAVRAAARRVVVERWSWAGVAARLIAPAG